MMYWDGDHASGWGIALMSLGMLAFWVLVVFAFVTLVRSFNRGGGAEPPPTYGGGQAPEQILAERFARGEIDEAEYARRLDALHGKLPT